MVEENFPIDEVIQILASESVKWDVPVFQLIRVHNRDPFKVLISTILSLRTKDEVTIEASKRLFEILKKPQDEANLNVEDIEKAIYPVGFYKRKAISIKGICKRLVIEFKGEIPSNLNTLLTFEGVGRKTANLVLAEGFNIPAICVDTHVHRISNRLGYIKTLEPEDSEFALRKILPQKYWIIYNTLLVAFGQGVCRPTSPYCSQCPIAKYCKKIGVTSSR